MEIPLLLLTLLIAALVLGEVRARQALAQNLLASSALTLAGPSATQGQTSSGESPEEPDELVTLPPPQAPAYTDKASQGEMVFAGQYLNFAGIALLTMGLISYLRVSGITHKVTSGGWLQCFLGASLGLGLSAAGQHYFRQGLRAYAQPLLASGISILLLTAGASHFYFHLLPSAGLVLAVFALAAWAGLAVIRYDSWLIGGCMLAALFLGPAVMTFSLNQVGLVVAYLLAINLATTVVAYHKKWDSILIASFLGSYGLYFSKFGLDYPWATLGFLTTTYALFLISGTVFHFLRRTASDFDLWLSLINPLAFVCASYSALLMLPNSLALATYILVAAVHIGLAVAARRLRGQGQAYLEMSQANLALGLLFATASVSFLTYCSDGNTFFGLVTFLWIAQSFGLLQLSLRLDEAYSLIVRRGSYLAMALTTVQLVYVIPTMADPYLLEIPAVLALLAYFRLNEASAQTREAHLFSNLVVLAALAAAHKSLMTDIFSVPTMIVGAALAPLMLQAYRRYPETLAPYRWGAPLVATIVTVTACCSPWAWQPQSLSLLLLAALVGSLTPLSQATPELEKESPLGALLASMLLLRGCWVLAHWNPALALVLAVALAFAGLRWSRSLERLEPAVAGLGVLLALLALGLPIRQLSDGLALVAVIAFYAEGCRELYRNRPELAAGSAAACGLLLMKGACLIHSGSGSTLIWCLLGLGLLRLGTAFASVAQLVFLLSFLKSIVFDANFIYGSAGMEIAGMHRPDLLQLSLVGAVVATFLMAARLARETPEWRNFFSLQGLVIFAFQTTSVLYHLFGILDNFQIILSGFWALASLLFIAYGIHGENKLFRLFGLVVLVSCVAKIYAVDINVLDAYDKSTTTLVLGSLLMIVSFLYQSNRARLSQPAAV